MAAGLILAATRINDPWGYLFPVLPLFAILAVMLFRWRARKKRSSQLSDLAMRSGLSFTAKPADSEVDGHLGGLTYLFDSQNSFLTMLFNPSANGFRNLIAGSHQGYPFAFFDYVVQRGRNSTLQYSVSVFDLRSAAPRFRLYHETIKDRIADRYSHSDIDIDFDSSFSHDYCLNAEDRTAVSQLFTPETVAAVRSAQMTHEIAIEAAGKKLMYYQKHLLAPDQFETFLEKGAGVAMAIDSQSFGNDSIWASGDEIGSTQPAEQT